MRLYEITLLGAFLMFALAVWAIVPRVKEAVRLDQELKESHVIIKAPQPYTNQAQAYIDFGAGTNAPAEDPILWLGPMTELEVGMRTDGTYVFRHIERKPPPWPPQSRPIPAEPYDTNFFLLPTDRLSPFGYSNSIPCVQVKL